jgi:hypothetical protein
MIDDYEAADIASLARDLLVAGRGEDQAWALAESFVAERKRRQEVVREQENEAKRRHGFERRVDLRAKQKLIAAKKAGEPVGLDLRREFDRLRPIAREELKRESEAMAQWEASK